MLKGFLYGIGASGSFGLIPLFTLPLMAWGVDTASILFYRFFISSLLLSVVLVATGRPLLIPRQDMLRLACMSFFYAAAAITFFIAFHYLASGIVATLQFICPVFVMLLMIVFFKERLRLSTIVAIGMAIGGVGLFSLKPGGTDSASIFGVAIVIFSALLNALYLIGIQVTRLYVTSGLTITFYLMLFGSLYTLLYALGTGGLTIPGTAEQWGMLLLLGSVTGLFSNLLLVAGVKSIGSTLTSVLGAMEPVTALCVGVLVFHEAFTWRSFGGAVLIISAVLLVMLAPRRGDSGGGK